MITGQFNFEIFKINVPKQMWSKMTYERPIVQTLGSRPVFAKNPNTDKFSLFVFSGMVPL